ncbi:MAG: Tetratricopeptide 2 repeat protein [Pedosphaera sp.]|nr:Tetratricopeptide 2 repeat protein [Pedosphaera sp.]
MVTNKKRRRNCLKVVLLTLIVAWAGGCTPPGPRALLEGKRLLDQGKYAPAVEKLKLASSLLTTNAQAWNYLGLAYHHAGQPTDAQDAYQKALKLNHDLIPVHYNLGCLLLEQNKLEAARDELTAFTLHQGNSLEGRLKLGTAQLRLRELGGAEKSFNEALRISPQNAEALNNLGIIQLQRNHPREAVADFNAALKQQPNYGPALLNLAVLLQSSQNSRALALQKYQEYLALNPRPANWEIVNATARQLDQELNPTVPARPAVLSPPIATAPPASPTRIASNNPVRVAVATTNPPKPEPTNPPRLASPPVVRQPVQAQPEPAVRPEAVQVPEATVIKPADDSVLAGQSAAVPVAGSESGVQMEPIASRASATKGAPKGFFQKMNPANLFHHDTKPAATTPLPLIVLSPPDSEPATPVSTNPGTVSKMTTPPPEASKAARRYAYVSPTKPLPGNRVEAERLFALALQAQREHRSPEAVAGYRAATQSDPSFFEAQSNLGLAAYDNGDMAISLFAYETALAITPKSFNARFNFALALRKTGYLIDAAQQLERLLVINPGESPSHLAATHLMLASLYSEQFHQPQAARLHYTKVLELEPGNSQATSIRYWLRDNP